MAFKPTREQAWEILTEYTKSDALIKHALAVEGVMRHFAELFGKMLKSGSDRSPARP